MKQTAKRSGLGARAVESAQNNPDKYLRGVLGQNPEPVSPPPGQPPGVPEGAGRRALWEQPPDTAGADGRMVPKTWHLPEELARRFDNFVLNKCPPGTRGVKVVRQILDDFLKTHGF